MRDRRPIATLLAVLLAAVAIASAAGGHQTAATVAAHRPDHSLTAVVRRTAHGIPHIEARSYAGLGYGYGYAFAQDNICTMADDYVTVRAERARYFGPDGEYEQRGNGVTTNNLDSDIFWKQVADSRVVEGLLAKKGRNAVKGEVRELVRGYVAGWNRYLGDVGGSRGVPDRRCRGKAWVRPISQRDAYLRFYQLVLLASGDVAIPGIAEAKPPTPPLGGLPVSAPSPQQIARGLARKLPIKSAGSNAVAIGRAGSRDHRHGVLLGNPHFPWLGTERFYQAHLRIPGKIDVAGVSLFGVPLVLIGHTKSMAWSHTVSTAFRFTPYQLTLVPGSPTTYLYDGKPLQMTHRTVSVLSRRADGSLARVTRTLYSTRYGAVFDSLVGVPLPWTPNTAFALADANVDNFRVFNHFFDTDRAQSAPQELAILKRHEGIPWVNTIVSDRAGRALYADIGAVPNVPNSKAQACNTAVGSATFQLLGLPVLDGSRSACNWNNDADAARPGIFGPSHMPQLFRSDYVTNSNDSYWLSNPHHPLEGFARIIGDERTPRSLRTRIGLIMTQARVDGSDHRGRPGFTRTAMQTMVFGDRQYAGELTRDDLVSMCRSFGGSAPTSSGPPVATGDACDVLARWDLHENLRSRGAILFRRFWSHANSSPASAAASVSPFADPFNPSDPVHTPHKLDTSKPTVRNALGDAIADLRGANIPLDVPVGQVQFVTRGGHRIPIHGGPGDPHGDFNAIYSSFSSGRGFKEPDDGSSFVQVVTWHRGHCPDARTILTYSQSTNPSSPWFADQAPLFSAKRWVPDRFCRGDVLRGTLSTTSLRQGARTKVTRARRR